MALIALVATACATPPSEDAARIDYDRAPPADWPELEVQVLHVSREDFAQVCPRLKAHSLGCATLDFCQRRCTIHLVPMNDPRYTEVLEHEEAHCLGYDHPGSSQGRDAWARAKATGC